MRKYSIISITLILLCYELFSFFIRKPLIIPSFSSILVEILTIMRDESFIEIIFMTVSQTLITFSLILLLGLVTGILSGYSNRIEVLLKPIITLLRTIPTISLIMILLIWFGRDLGPIVMVGLVIFPILYEIVLGSIKRVENDLKDVCVLFGCTEFEKFRALYYPNLIYSLSSGIQATLGLAFKVMVMAEVLSQSRIGIGQALNYEKTYLNMSGVFGWTFILVIIVILFDFLINLFMKWLLRKLD